MGSSVLQRALLQDQVFRQELSSGTDAFCPRCAMYGGGKKEKQRCFGFVLYFSTLTPFNLQIFASGCMDLVVNR